MQGGIFFGKMPLGLDLFVKSRIETAVIAEELIERWLGNSQATS